MALMRELWRTFLLNWKWRRYERNCVRESRRFQNEFR